MKVIRILILGLCCYWVFACERQRIELNEPLRLSPAELRENTKLAENGDAPAAKRVWHHYEFAEGDVQKADEWKARYERLRDKK